MNETHRQFVVYMVNVGGYDEVWQPKVVDSRFDYVLFTDQKKSDRIGAWKVRTFDYYNDDKKRMSNYVKLQACRCLPEYQASLFIDGNIQLTGSDIYDKCARYYAQGVDWAGLRHPGNDCLYNEAYAVILSGYEKPSPVIDWSRRLRKDNFPRHWGLHETRMIFRRHTDSVSLIETGWWSLYEKYARRDQLFQSYVFWKHGNLNKAFLSPDGGSVWDMTDVCIHAHAKQSSKVRLAHHTYSGYVQLRLMNQYPRIKKFMQDLYYSVCGCSKPVVVITITMVRLLCFIVYAPVVYFKKYCLGRR